MILITGASGQIGSRVAQLLAARGYPLRLMTRDPARAPSLPGCDVVQGDFAHPETLNQAFAGVETALVISGQAPPGERALTHRNAFEAARQAGAKHVIYLSLKGAGPQSKYGYCRDHFQSEQFLAATGLPHTVLRNAFYQDMFFTKFDLAGVMIGTAGQGQGAYVAREDAARAAAAAVEQKPTGTWEITGPESLKVSEIAMCLSTHVGRTLQYQEVSAERLRIHLRQSDLPAWRQELEAQWFAAIGAGEQSPPADGFQRLVGGKPQTLEEYVSSFPDLLRPLH